MRVVRNPRPMFAWQKKSKPQRLPAPSNDIKYVFLHNWEEKKINDKAAQWEKTLLYFHYLVQCPDLGRSFSGKENTRALSL